MGRIAQSSSADVASAHDDEHSRTNGRAFSADQSR
jgi:hypothetical protein